MTDRTGLVAELNNRRNAMLNEADRLEDLAAQILADVNEDMPVPV